MLRTMMTKPSSKVRWDNDQQHIHTFYICCYLVLEDVSWWNIDNVEEDQIFEKRDYRVMLVIPS